MQAIKNHVFSVGGLINIGFAAHDAYSNYKENPRSGVLSAVGRAAINFAAAEMIPGYVGAQMLSGLARAAGEMAYHGYHNGPHMAMMMGGAFGNVNPIDTANSATMRQRSLAALGQSRMNARNLLGSEARMLHRNQVSY